MGAINCDFAVYIEWTNGKDMGVRSNAWGVSIGNHESALVFWGIPNSLRWNDLVVGIENVSIIALKIVCSALLKSPAVS